jgi:acetyl-CoA carboxylase biotin carboxyl carrier protein
MDIKQVQELVKIINKTNIAEISIEEEGFKITIKQKEEPTPPMMAPVHTTYMQAPQQAPAPAAAPVTVKSPMIGTFYRSPSPDKPVFVNIGDDISVGKVVCIIEAMKLFNEIESEVRGRIVKVLVEDASPVEYDQPLFLVDPS